MATSTQGEIFSNLTYNDEIYNFILNSGGTIVFMKDNMIVASEVSESQYRDLLNNPHIEKIDVVALKRYGNNTIEYKQSKKSNEYQQNNQTK